MKCGLFITKNDIKITYAGNVNTKPGPKVIKFLSYSTQLSMKFILLMNVKMLTIVSILTFISMINQGGHTILENKFPDFSLIFP